MSRRIPFKPEVLKLTLDKANIQNFFAYSKLDNKTQMIRNIDNINKIYRFTDRKIHTDFVADVAQLIYKKKFLHIEGLNLERLYYSALLHDIGHTPFGHACEEEINDQFLSNDKLHYSASKPGLFKHNVNSVKLISEYFQVNDNNYVLIDSILKHSRTFPKNYNYKLFEDTNILKCNYIFDNIKFASSFVVNEFVDCFISKCRFCPSRSKNSVPSREMCYACKKKKICFFKASDYTDRHKLSLYLAYPFPLTIEGTILFWADEIACFCRDILDYCCFVKLYDSSNLKSLISLTSIMSKIDFLEVNYGSNILITFIKQCFNDLNQNYSTELDFVSYYKNLLINPSNKDSLVSILITLLDNSLTFNNCIDIKMVGEECLPLFSFDDNTNKIFKSIKDTIYEDIHKVDYIDKSNKAGKQAVDYLINYFLKNLGCFIKTYKRRSNHKKKDICLNFAFSTMSILGMSKSLRKQKRNEYINLYKKWNIIINDESSLYDIPLIKEHADGRDCEYILNMLKREIGYFVATLSEKEIFELFDELKKTTEDTVIIEKIINKFPKKYMLNENT